MSIVNLILINGNEITEHNRTFESSELLSVNDIDLASGHKRRFYKDNKKEFSFSWSYLPSLQSKTVDNRKGQIYLETLGNIRGTVTVAIQTVPDGQYDEYTCYVDSYSKTLIRRDFSTQCSYYDVSLTLVEA